MKKIWQNTNKATIILLVFLLLFSCSFTIFYSEWTFSKEVYFNLFWAIHYSTIIILSFLFFRFILSKSKMTPLILAISLSIVLMIYIGFKLLNFSFLLFEYCLFFFLIFWITFSILNKYKNAIYFLALASIIIVFYFQFNPIGRARLPVDVKVLSESNNEKWVVREYKLGKSNQIVIDTAQVKDIFIFRKILKE